MGVTLEDRWIGERLIDARVITREQRDKVLEIQSEPINHYRRFGDIAVDQGFCERAAIESISGFLGQLLVAEGLMSEEQVKAILKLQQSMREGGLHVPNFGEMAALREYCSKEDIERVIAIKRRLHMDIKATMPDETSDW